MEQFTEIEYSVGLTREEYARSQELVNRTLRGRPQLFSRIFSIAMMVMCVIALAAEYRLTGTIEPALAVVMTLMIIAEVWIMLSTPRQLRKRHEAAYDGTIFSGHCFDGVLKVDEDGVEKRTADDTTRVRFSDCAMFIEAEDMMLFCVNGGKSIVVPARCLTPEDADFTKHVAFAKIPKTRQCLIEPIAAKLETRAPLVMTVPEEDDILLTVNVEFTEKELKGQLSETAMEQFVGLLPQKVLVSVFLTIMVYFAFEITPLPVFLLGMLVLFLWELLRARMRAGQAIRVTDGAAKNVTLELGEKALYIQGKGQGARKMTLPWSYITRAGEWPSEVVFFAEKKRIFTVPKRCIEDMDALRSVVDAHLAK